MASVTIVFRSDKLNRKGEGPVHFRITKNRKSSYISSGIRIHPRKWDEKKGKIKATCSNSARLNAYLSSKFSEIQDTVLQYEITSRSLTSKNLKEKVFGKRPSDFFAFADTVVEQYRKEGRVGTCDKNRSVVSKLRAYRPSLTFDDITPEFLAKYEQYLRDELGNLTNTVNKDMKFLRKVFNDAIRQDIVEQPATPFRKYQMRTEKTRRDHLNEEELKRIEDCTAGPGAKLKTLAKLAGIEKRLSFHISRHSFAIMGLRKGISFDKISKLMAHSAIRETQIYAKIVNEELDKAMEVFNV